MTNYTTKETSLELHELTGLETEKQKAVSENEKIREMLNDPEVIGKAAKGAIKAQRKMAGLESEENENGKI